MAGDVGRETDTGFRAGRYGQRALLGVGRMKRLKEVLERNKKLRKKLGKKGPLIKKNLTKDMDKLKASLIL